MKDMENIQAQLVGLTFSGYGKYIQQLLEIFNISRTTILRLTKKAEENNYSVPIFLYRRAVFICVKDGQCEDWLISQYANKYPLIILLFPNHIVIQGEESEKVSCLYEEVHQHLLLLKPIYQKKKQDKDIYEALDFASLIAQLKNQLCLENPGNLYIVDFILDIIIISFAQSTIKDNQLQNVLEWHKGNSLNGIWENVEKEISLNGYNRLLQEMNFPQSLKQNASIEQLIFRILSYDMSHIDPEVLGSLIYKLLDENADITLFGHQTSYQNINKLLRPLFFDSIHNDILNHVGDYDELNRISKDIRNAVFFDPTNGPGCFLSSALTFVIELSQKIEEYIPEKLPLIDIRNFVGLVTNRLSKRLSHIMLWVSYIQYLSGYGCLTIESLVSVYNRITIYMGNQLTTSWNSICPNTGNVYVFGSPIFRGLRKMSSEMKADMKYVYGTPKLYGADYCSAWLVKAAEYIKGSASKASFVLTNSVCQGEQVQIIWNKVFETKCHICFAHQSFKWQNSSNENVGVSVIIVGLSTPVDKSMPLLIEKGRSYNCEKIGPYLIPNNTTIVVARSKPLSPVFPRMRKGNMPYDQGNLLLTKDERDILLAGHPQAKKFIKRLVGSDEYIKGIPRYCLWIPDGLLEEAFSIPPIAERIEKVREFRSDKNLSTKTRNNPHQFREFYSTGVNSQTLIVPSVSSENRDFIPIGFIYDNTIVSNLAFSIYDCEPWILSVLVSNMHQLWVKTVCGKLESRIRYSNELGYNTFPFPDISEEQKSHLTTLALDLVKMREEYCHTSLGALYSSLPPKLKAQHQFIDEYVEACYREDTFISDTEKLFFLLDMYTHTLTF